MEYSHIYGNHLLYSPDLAPSDFHLFLHVKKFLSGQGQHIQNDREAQINITQWFQSLAVTSMIQVHKCWSHGVTNISIPEANMLKNSSTLAVSVQINLSIKLGFVDPSGQVVITLATGSEIRRFNPGRGRWMFFRA